MILLLEYDPKRGSLVSMRRFEDREREEAPAARLDMELDLRRKGLTREAKLLEAPDEATIRRTHRRCFESLESLVRCPIPVS